ncbi:hypothetical protein NVV94_08375 [Pseudomonas sp. LS1212]|uniref:hypothetical protein n=1 Tax=Pseudomonas sp. LS1212 TaxID=2972478 RepID=UPI00215CBAAA|nr:hypothetical protein [Pseudomonas sp. LS1212]UVJ45558.1 hypothetical protein NVV94_08375 [Pseudomonas sp. LS1212]
MNFGILSITAATIIISGCAYSQKNFKEIGDFADRGDYVAVAFRSTVGVVVSGMVDVVSLGGTLTPEQAQETWTSPTQGANTTNGFSNCPNDGGLDIGGGCYDPHAVERMPKKERTNQSSPSGGAVGQNSGVR